MAEYFSNKEDAESYIRRASMPVVLFARIQLHGSEKWMVDHERRDLGSSIRILEDLSGGTGRSAEHAIGAILAGRHSSNAESTRGKKLPTSTVRETPTAARGGTRLKTQHPAGPSHFWRCPHCQSILQKKRQGFGGAIVLGSVSCGSCGRSLSASEVYGGKYDLPEVDLHCPHCNTHLRGPSEDLLGKPCPACNRTLPSSENQPTIDTRSNRETRTNDPREALGLLFGNIALNIPELSDRDIETQLHDWSGDANAKPIRGTREELESVILPYLESYIRQPRFEGFLVELNKRWHCVCVKILYNGRAGLLMLWRGSRTLAVMATGEFPLKTNAPPKTARAPSNERIRFNCPQCTKGVTVRTEYAGKKGKCPSCGSVVPIPNFIHSVALLATASQGGSEAPIPEVVHTTNQALEFPTANRRSAPADCPDHKSAVNTESDGQGSRSYRIGDRVRFRDHGCGTAKPSETGYAEPVLLEERGREGTIVKFNERGFPIIRWDRGIYRISRGIDATARALVEGTVQLNAFETGMHPDWIAPANEPMGKPVHEPPLDIATIADPSSFECERCHKRGLHRRVNDQYAGDLWVCPSCGYKTLRHGGM